MYLQNTGDSVSCPLFPKQPETFAESSVERRLDGKVLEFWLKYCGPSVLVRCKTLVDGINHYAEDEGHRATVLDAHLLLFRQVLYLELEEWVEASCFNGQFIILLCWVLRTF